MAIYGLSTITAATADPVTVPEAKRQCGIALDTTYHDEDVLRLIKAATGKVEADTGRALMAQTLDFVTDHFPVGLEPLYLPRSPVSSVTHVKYYDTSGVEQTLATTVYQTIANREPPEIRLKYQQTWPMLYSQDAVVTVRMVCGYASAQVVPAGLKSLVLYYVHHLFDPEWPGFTEESYRSKVAQHTVGDEFHCYAR